MYSRYARDIIQENCRDALARVLSRPDAYSALQSAGHGFREAVKYYLPKLLMTPVWHCFLYFDYVQVRKFLQSSIRAARAGLSSCHFRVSETSRTNAG